MRRVKAAAAATGVVVAGVLAMPSLAGAESMDHDMEPTTTVAPTTTTLATTTTTTIAVTTTTARVPQLTQGGVHAPGDHVTVSGDGCKIDGKPGTVIVALGTETRAGLLPERAAANADGTYSITVTLPADVESGEAALVTGCTDDLTQSFVLDGVVFIVQRPGEPAGKIEQNTGALKNKAAAKLKAPKAVKSTPTFTG
jgi:hypothetical protein